MDNRALQNPSYDTDEMKFYKDNHTTTVNSKLKFFSQRVFRQYVALKNISFLNEFKLSNRQKDIIIRSPDKIDFTGKELIAAYENAIKTIREYFFCGYSHFVYDLIELEKTLQLLPDLVELLLKEKILEERDPKDKSLAKPALKY